MPVVIAVLALLLAVRHCLAKQALGGVSQEVAALTPHAHEIQHLNHSECLRLCRRRRRSGGKRRKSRWTSASSRPRRLPPRLPAPRQITGPGRSGVQLQRPRWRSASRMQPPSKPGMHSRTCTHRAVVSQHCTACRRPVKLAALMAARLLWALVMGGACC